jgi:hypothetical protein
VIAAAASWYQGCSARRGATASEKAGTAAHDAVEVASRTLSETQRSNEVQRKANEITFKNSVEDFHLEQRAWVTINAVALVSMNKNERLNMRHFAVNGGKTITFDVSGVNVMAFPLTELERFSYKDGSGKTLKPRQVGLMVPGVAYPADFYSAHELNEQQIQAITAGKLLVEDYGYLSYKDVFNIPHITEFCFLYSATYKAFMPCEKHNSAN